MAKCCKSTAVWSRNINSHLKYINKNRAYNSFWSHFYASIRQMRQINSALLGRVMAASLVARGGADVKLIADGDNTLLRYTAKAETGGKIAQLGSRLIISVAWKLSGVFENFKKICAVRCLKIAVTHCQIVSLRNDAALSYK